MRVGPRRPTIRWIARPPDKERRPGPGLESRVVRFRADDDADSGRIQAAVQEVDQVVLLSNVSNRRRMVSMSANSGAS